MQVFRSGWDLTIFNISSHMAEPFCEAWRLVRFRLISPLGPEQFENYDSRVAEVAARSLIAVGVVSSIALTVVWPVPVVTGVLTMAVGSQLLKKLGCIVQKGGYSYARGDAPEKVLDPENFEIRPATFNLCGVGGGLSYDHGGVVHWKFRFKEIIEKIKNAKADVVLLPEVGYDTEFERQIYRALKSEYAHFFMHLGPAAPGSKGGCMVLSKCAVHSFTHTSFSNNHWTLNRGFATLEIKASSQATEPCFRFIGTHLIHGTEESDREKRLVQVSEIVASVANATSALPTLFAGDLNIERDQKEGKILSFLRHGYQGKAPTCTNQLVAKWTPSRKSEPDETIDYLSLFKTAIPGGTKLPVVEEGVEFKDCKLIEMYDATHNTKRALSDHHGMVATVSVQKRRRFALLQRVYTLLGVSG